MVASIWNKPLPGEIREIIRQSLGSGGTDTPLQVFFRADDIGFVDERFRRLMQLFAAHQTPLCLALVPAWLNKDVWAGMQEFTPERPLWCWHQHGWNHSNHEPAGKKCEFGAGRNPLAVRTELKDGRQRLTDLLGGLFVPVFTPPWNRCSRETMEMLLELGYLAVSRSEGAKPLAPQGLPDFAVNVDLHTRKEDDCREGWQNLLKKMTNAVNKGRVGFMIHHQLMNSTAHDFLEILLTELHRRPQVAFCDFRKLHPAFEP